MPWTDELVPITRAIIMDDVSPYEFSDSRLLHLLAVSAFQVYQRIGDRLARTYEIDVVSDTISPDPAGTSLSDADRDESFMNLIALQAACTTQKGAARRAANTGFALKDGAGFVDTRGKTTALVELLKSGRSYCQDFEDALAKFLADDSGIAAATVIGPYRASLASMGGRRPSSGMSGARYFG